PNLFEDVAELIPILRVDEIVVRVVEHAQFCGGPAEGIGFVTVEANDWAVTCDDDANVLVGFVLNVNRFVGDLSLLPLTFDAIFVGICWIECLYIKVLDVGTVVGETPGDAVIVADDDKRTAGQSKSFDIPAGRCEMRLVPYGRNREFEMRVVGEKRFARGGVRAADNPVVAAE